MEEIVFKPKYRPLFIISVPMLLLLEVYVLQQIFLEHDTSSMNVFSAVLFGVLITFMPYMYIRRIIFDQDVFLVERYLWPTKSIGYADIMDIGYQIRRRGNLDPKWSDWFDGFAISCQEDETVLTGTVSDQTALHGILYKINSLSLALISVSQLPNLQASAVNVKP